jgi:hypothetical protein
MQNYFKIKIFVFGMETVRNNIFKVSESIDNKVILVLYMDFNGDTGMHLIQQKMLIILEKV